MKCQNYNSEHTYFIRWFIDKWNIETLYTSNNKEECLIILRKVFKRFPDRHPFIISNLMNFTYYL